MKVSEVIGYLEHTIRRFGDIEVGVFGLDADDEDEMCDEDDDR